MQSEACSGNSTLGLAEGVRLHRKHTQGQLSVGRYMDAITGSSIVVTGSSRRSEDKATPWSTLPLGKIVVLLSLSLAPVITGRCVPTPSGTTSQEPTPRTTERSTPRACRTRRPPILISLTCTLRSDQCLTALGRHSRRRKFPRLYARTNRDSAPGWPRTDGTTAESSSARTSPP